MTVPSDHPRHASLVVRDRLVDALHAGILAEQGLAAHGRGEAFDYLIGESTMPSARVSIDAAAAHLALAKRPVVSVNGNAAALAPDALVALARAVGARIEVNLFHRTPERVARIIAHLGSHGARDVLGSAPDTRIPGLSSDRAFSSRDGIHGADVVFVPLEDGDRCGALRAMGKTVIVVDLNPLSRTARTASVTIVDNLVRCAPGLAGAVAAARDAPREALVARVAAYDHGTNLAEALAHIRGRLDALAAAWRSGRPDA